jgi:hypothetical protein
MTHRYDHESAYDRELAELTDERAGELRAFLAAADAALKRDGLSHHPRPMFLDLLWDFLDERDRRQRAARTLH